MGIPKPGDPWGPGRFTAGHPDQKAHEKRYPKPSPWGPNPYHVGPNVADPPGPLLPERTARTAKSGGSFLGLVAGVVILVLIFAHKIPIAAIIGIFLLLGVAYFFRKALLALAVVGGMLFGLYGIYQVLK